MPRRKKAKGGSATKSEGDTRREAVNLLIAYIKQETLDPLKGLGRFVLFGVAGSVTIAVGAVLLLVAALRILQTETAVFRGNLSWLPYVIVTALGVAIVGLATWRIFAGPAARRTAPKKSGD